MNVSEPFILRPVATILLMVAILLAGASAFRLLPLATLPEVDYPTIQVQTFYPGASPEVMTSAVTAPLEVQLGQMQGLNQMLSASSGGVKKPKPPHPGDLIRTEVIEALGLTVSKAAEILKVRRATLSDLLHGKAALTPEMALRIEKAFGPEMDHLLRMQLAYDVAKTRQHARGLSIKRYAPA